MTEPTERERLRYEYAVQPGAATAAAQVIELVGRDQRVLEFGCGPGSITRSLHANGCTVTGIDYDAQALERAQAFCERVAQFDLNAADWSGVAEEGAYGRVVAADVLEHLYDPRAALRQMLRFLAPGGRLVLSIPHVGHAAIAASLVKGDFEYREWGLLDSTHIRFFGLANMDRLLADAGLVPDAVRFVLRRPDETEFAPLWESLSAQVRSALESAPHAHVYQVVVSVARSGELVQTGQPVSIASALPRAERWRAMDWPAPGPAGGASPAAQKEGKPAAHGSNGDPRPDTPALAVGTGLAPDAPRLIAYYLPQFHPFAENDQWWGKGFTEWTNTTKALPLFAGHYQPHLPTELGFYDLRLPETLHQQVALAKAYGIHGFCYHYYWFSGKRLMEQPLERMLADPTLDMPFCLCWANENWTRRWDAAEHEVLIAQRYAPGDDERFIDELLPYLADPRYIRVGGKPLLIVYRPQHLPDAPRSAAIWRARVEAAGLPGLFICAALTHGNTTFRQFGFDGAVEFPPHAPLTVGNHNHEIDFHAPFHGNAMMFHEIAGSYLARDYAEQPVVRTVYPSWDNTARTKNRALVTLNGTPGNYEHWLARAVDASRPLAQGEPPLVFINAWNEWAEGCHLEPDRVHGRAFLEATLRVLRGERRFGDFPDQELPPEQRRMEAPRHFWPEQRALMRYHLALRVGTAKLWVNRRPWLRNLLLPLVRVARRVRAAVSSSG